MLGKVIKAKRQAEAKIVVMIADAILMQLLHHENAVLEELWSYQTIHNAYVSTVQNH